MSVITCRDREILLFAHFLPLHLCETTQAFFLLQGPLSTCFQDKHKNALVMTFTISLVETVCDFFFGFLQVEPDKYEFQGRSANQSILKIIADRSPISPEIST